jgi:hypothetical protein
MQLRTKPQLRRIEADMETQALRPSFSRHDRERQHFRLDHQMKGRPLTRDEAHRIDAQTIGLRGGIRTSATGHSFLVLSAVQELTALFVLGMLGGIAAVFIALFLL